VRVHAVCPSFVDTPLVKGKDGLDEYVAMAGGRSVPVSLCMYLHRYCMIHNGGHCPRATISEQICDPPLGS
jgi:hypothetical protein